VSFYQVKVDTDLEEPQPTSSAYGSQPALVSTSAESNPRGGTYRKAAPRRVTFDRGGVTYVPENEYRPGTQLPRQHNSSVEPTGTILYQNQDGFTFQKSTRTDPIPTSKSGVGKSLNGSMVKGDFVAPEPSADAQIQSQQQQQTQQAPGQTGYLPQPLPGTYSGPMVPGPYGVPIAPAAHAMYLPPYGLMAGYGGPYSAMPHPGMGLGIPRMDSYYGLGAMPHGGVIPDAYRGQHAHQQADGDDDEMTHQPVTKSKPVVQARQQDQQEARGRGAGGAATAPAPRPPAPISPYRIRRPGPATHFKGRPRYDDPGDVADKDPTTTQSDTARIGVEPAKVANAQTQKTTRSGSIGGSQVDPKVSGQAALRIPYPEDVSVPFVLRIGLKTPIQRASNQAHLYSKSEEVRSEMSDTLVTSAMVLEVPPSIADEPQGPNAGEEYCMFAAALRASHFDESVKNYAIDLANKHVIAAKATFTEESKASFVADAIESVVKEFCRRVSDPRESFASLVRSAVSVSMDTEALQNESSAETKTDSTTGARGYDGVGAFHHALTREEEAEEEALALRTMGLSKRKPAGQGQELSVGTAAASTEAEKPTALIPPVPAEPVTTLGQFATPQLDLPSVRTPMPKGLTPNELISRTVPLIPSVETVQKMQLAHAYEKLLKEIEKEIAEWKLVQQMVRDIGKSDSTDASTDAVLETVTAPTAASRAQRSGSEQVESSGPSSSIVLEKVEQEYLAQRDHYKNVTNEDQLSQDLALELLDRFDSAYSSISISDSHSLTLLRNMRKILAESDSYRKTVSRCISAATQPPVSANEVQNLVSSLLSGSNPSGSNAGSHDRH